jgi:RecJ-like exonuclease
MKRIFVLLAILMIGAVFYGVYLFNMKPANTRDEEVDFEMSSTGLMKEFSLDELKATKKYSDKILLISGKVTEINLTSATIFLDASDPLAAVTCSFYADELPRMQLLKKGEVVQVKGKCTGKLIDVVLNNCIINSSN